MNSNSEGVYVTPLSLQIESMKSCFETSSRDPKIFANACSEL